MKKRLYILLLSILALAAKAQNGDIHILAVNDLHAAIERFPQFEMVADSLRHIYPDLLVLSAGDNRTGNPVNDTYPEPSRPMVELMNRAGFNYTTIGNHEFDGGINSLRSVINNSNFRHICANMIIPDSLRLHIEPFTFVERNGVKIGILGLVQTNPKTGYPDAHPQLFGTVKFEPVKKVAREYAWIRNECDVFLLLTHIGFANDLELAKIMPEADLIIGGHSHTKVDPCRMVDNVMVTQAERWLKYATFITVKVRKGKVTDKQAQLIDVANYPKKNEETRQLVDFFSDNKVLKRILTQAVSDFSSKEELGCMMTDALKTELEADIAVQNAGGVRYDTKEKGDFTVNDVYRLDPFGNKMVEINLDGEEVERLLAAICKADEYGPAFVSGLHYKIHLGKDRDDIKSISITLPDGSPIDSKQKYRVVMSSYVASIAKYKKKDDGRNLFVTSSDLLIRYLEKQPSIDYKHRKCVEITQDIQLTR